MDAENNDGRDCDLCLRGSLNIGLSCKSSAICSHLEQAHEREWCSSSRIDRDNYLKGKRGDVASTGQGRGHAEKIEERRVQ
jgi:hypothetical protein